MKAVKIKLDYTINLGNYNNIKLGGEWEVNEDENLQDAFIAARAEINKTMEVFKKIREDKELAKQAQESK